MSGPVSVVPRPCGTARAGMDCECVARVGIHCAETAREGVDLGGTARRKTQGVRRRAAVLLLCAALLTAATAGCAKNAPSAETDDSVSVGEFTAALWNLMGCPGEAERNTPSGSTPNPAADSDARNAAAWLEAEGIWDGIPLERPAPEEPLNRLTAMELLFTLNGRRSGMEAVLTGVYDSAFKDSGSIPEENKAALYWGFFNVLIRETEPDYIAPFSAVSRGDMSEMLMRYGDDFLSDAETSPE